MTQPRLTLKPVPDGLGFFYGTLVVDDEVYRVDIMPPIGEWRGDIRSTTFGPDATDWVVYLDGKEIARVRKRTDLERAITGVLTAS